MKESLMTEALTRKQREVYHYLVEHQDQFREAPPTLDQLCHHLGLKSRGSLHKHIHALIDANLLEPIEGLHRGIRLKQEEPENSSENQLPFVGRIAAGLPIEAIEESEQIDIPPQLKTARTCFVLQVDGESMINAGILDGDYVVIEQRNSARNGEIVVALIEGEEATLKTLEQRPGEVILHPANDSMQPMHYSPDQVQIQGVLVGQMRSYQ